MALNFSDSPEHIISAIYDCFMLTSLLRLCGIGIRMLLFWHCAAVTATWQTNKHSSTIGCMQRQTNKQECIESWRTAQFRHNPKDVVNRSESLAACNLFHLKTVRCTNEAHTLAPKQNMHPINAVKQRDSAKDTDWHLAKMIENYLQKNNQTKIMAMLSRQRKRGDNKRDFAKREKRNWIETRCWLFVIFVKNK